MRINGYLKDYKAKKHEESWQSEIRICDDTQDCQMKWKHLDMELKDRMPNLFYSFKLKGNKTEKTHGKCKEQT